MSDRTVWSLWCLSKQFIKSAFLSSSLWFFDGAAGDREGRPFDAVLWRLTTRFHESLHAEKETKAYLYFKSLSVMTSPAGWVQGATIPSRTRVMRHKQPSHEFRFRRKIATFVLLIASYKTSLTSFAFSQLFPWLLPGRKGNFTLPLTLTSTSNWWLIVM